MSDGGGLSTSWILFGFALGCWVSHLNHRFKIKRALKEKLIVLDQLTKTLDTLLAEKSKARARAEKARFN